MLSITEKGHIFVYRDPRAEQWLGWDDRPDPARATAIQKELSIIAEAVDKAEKAGETAPKKSYELRHFKRLLGEWPPQTITVPKAVLEEMHKTITRIEESLERLRSARFHEG